MCMELKTNHFRYVSVCVNKVIEYYPDGLKNRYTEINNHN